MAITVRITPISERPRLLTLGDSNTTSSPPAPPTSRSASPDSVQDSDSAADDAVPADIPSPHVRYLPIRTNSSPEASSSSRRTPHPHHHPRPPMLRAPASSPVDSHPDTHLPFSSSSSSTSSPISESDDPWALPPANYIPAPALPYYPPSPSASASPIPALKVRPPRTRPNSRVVQPLSPPQYLRSRSSLSSSTSSSSSSGKRSWKSKDRKRSEMMRCGRHGDEWLFEGWGSWFRRFWRE